MTFGERLKEFKIEYGVTQQDLADELHITKQAISSWEKGQCGPGIKTLIKLAIFFNTTTDYLLGNSNNRYKTKEQAEAVLIDRETEILEKLEICRADIKELHEMIDATLFSFEKLKVKEG